MTCITQDGLVKHVRLTRSIQAGDAPPTEFRLFAVGSNDSTSGPALWDEKAAKLTMARAAERAGVRYPIDLEHRSLDSQARVMTKDATDAMGWFDLEVRGGELWAVNVTWNDEGAERLRSKRQVYFSPAFYTDDEGRVIELVNIALTSMPATHGLAPLVAASRVALRSASTQEVARALDAALYDKFPRSDTAPGAYACDIYPDAVIVDYDGKLLRIPYTYADGIATLTGEPVQVTRQYVPVGAAARRVAIALAERRLASCKSRATLRNT